MEKEKLSSREAALIAQARREAEAQKSGNPPPAAAAEEKPTVNAASVAATDRGIRVVIMLYPLWD